MKAIFIVLTFVCAFVAAGCVETQESQDEEEVSETEAPLTAIGPTRNVTPSTMQRLAMKPLP